MALVLANRVQEAGTANTTVSFTLTGALTGFNHLRLLAIPTQRFMLLPTLLVTGKLVSARIQLRGRLSRARPSTLLATLEVQLLSVALATFLLPTHLVGL